MHKNPEKDASTTSTTLFDRETIGSSITLNETLLINGLYHYAIRQDYTWLLRQETLGADLMKICQHLQDQGKLPQGMHEFLSEDMEARYLALRETNPTLYNEMQTIIERVALKLRPDEILDQKPKTIDPTPREFYQGYLNRFTTEHLQEHHLLEDCYKKLKDTIKQLDQKQWQDAELIQTMTKQHQALCDMEIKYLHRPYEVIYEEDLMLFSDYDGEQVLRGNSLSKKQIYFLNAVFSTLYPPSGQYWEYLSNVCTYWENEGILPKQMHVFLSPSHVSSAQQAIEQSSDFAAHVSKETTRLARIIRTQMTNAFHTLPPSEPAWMVGEESRLCGAPGLLDRLFVPNTLPVTDALILHETLNRVIPHHKPDGTPHTPQERASLCRFVEAHGVLPTGASDYLVHSVSELGHIHLQTQIQAEVDNYARRRSPRGQLNLKQRLFQYNDLIKPLNKLKSIPAFTQHVENLLQTLRTTGCDLEAYQAVIEQSKPFQAFIQADNQIHYTWGAKNDLIEYTLYLKQSTHIKPDEFLKRPQQLLQEAQALGVDVGTLCERRLMCDRIEDLFESIEIYHQQLEPNAHELAHKLRHKLQQTLENQWQTHPREFIDDCWALEEQLFEITQAHGREFYHQVLEQWTPAPRSTDPEFRLHLEQFKQTFAALDGCAWNHDVLLDNIQIAFEKMRALEMKHHQTNSTSVNETRASFHSAVHAVNVQPSMRSMQKIPYTPPSAQDIDAMHRYMETLIKSLKKDPTNEEAQHKLRRAMQRLGVNHVIDSTDFFSPDMDVFDRDYVLMISKTPHGLSMTQNDPRSLFLNRQTPRHTFVTPDVHHVFALHHIHHTAMPLPSHIPGPQASVESMRVKQHPTSMSATQAPTITRTAPSVFIEQKSAGSLVPVEPTIKPTQMIRQIIETIIHHTKALPELLTGHQARDRLIKDTRAEYIRIRKILEVHTGCNNLSDIDVVELNHQAHALDEKYKALKDRHAKTKQAIGATFDQHATGIGKLFVVGCGAHLGGEIGSAFIQHLKQHTTIGESTEYTLIGLSGLSGALLMAYPMMGANSLPLVAGFGVLSLSADFFRTDPAQTPQIQALESIVQLINDVIMVPFSPFSGAFKQLMEQTPLKQRAQAGLKIEDLRNSRGDLNLQEVMTRLQDQGALLKPGEDAPPVAIIEEMKKCLSNLQESYAKYARAWEASGCPLDMDYNSPYVIPDRPSQPKSETSEVQTPKSEPAITPRPTQGIWGVKPLSVAKHSGSFWKQSTAQRPTITSIIPGQASSTLARLQQNLKTTSAVPQPTKQGSDVVVRSAVTPTIIETAINQTATAHTRMTSSLTTPAQALHEQITIPASVTAFQRQQQSLFADSRAALIAPNHMHTTPIRAQEFYGAASVREHLERIAHPAPNPTGFFERVAQPHFNATLHAIGLPAESPSVALHRLAHQNQAPINPHARDMYRHAKF